MQTAVELDPANAGARRVLARIYLEQNNPTAAAAELRRAIQSKPSADAHFELGLAEGQLGNLDAAAAQFRKAIQLDPQMASAYSRLGVTLRRQGNHKAALAEFRKAAELDSKNAQAQYELGMELKADGDMAAALAAFQRAVDLKPDFEQAHYNLGIALRAQGQTKAAQAELQELKGLHDFRTRLAQSKSLILQGVDALKAEKLDEPWHYSSSRWRRARNCPRDITTWA